MDTASATTKPGAGLASVKAACQDDLIAAVLRGECPPALAVLKGSEIEDLIERGWYHNVLPLLHEALQRIEDAHRALLEGLRLSSRGLAIWELQHRKILQRLAVEFSRAGIEVICFKGTALAYGVYAKPHLRSRGDSDLLIKPDDLPNCRAVLAGLGFERAHALPGKQISQEETWHLKIGEGAKHSIDLHWQISNSRLLSRHWTWEDLRATAERPPALAGFMVPDRATALLIACMHFAVHRGESLISNAGVTHSGHRLFWLYDVHLLAEGLSRSEWQKVLQIADAKGMSVTAAGGLALSRSRFNSEIPAEVISQLSRAGRRGTLDAYLAASPRRREFIDFAAIGQLSGRLRYTRELLLPSTAYLKAKYPRARVSIVPWLHLRRWCDGLQKRLMPRVPDKSGDPSLGSLEVESR